MLTIPPITIANTMPDLVSRVQQVIDALNAGVVNVTANVALLANNTTNFNGQPASFYANANNLTTGTLADARLTTNIALLNRTPQVWTGFQSFELNAQIKTTLPTLIFFETDRGTDLKAWDIAVEGEVFAIRTLTDALSVAALPIQINRSGLLVSAGGFKTTGSPSFTPGVIGFFSSAMSIVGGTNGVTFVSSDGGSTNFSVSDAGVAQTRTDLIVGTTALINSTLSSKGQYAQHDHSADVERGYRIFTGGGAFSNERAFIGGTGNNSNHGGIIRLTNGGVVLARVVIGADFGAQLNVSGDSAVKPTSSVWTISSDERTKRNVQTWSGSGLDIVRNVRFVQYEYNGLADTPVGERGIGVVAQELETVLPRAVSRIRRKLRKTDVAATDVMHVNYHELFMAYGDALKTLDTRLTALEGA